MTHVRLIQVSAIALVAILAVAGCKKKEPVAEAPMPAPAATMPAPAPMPTTPAPAGAEVVGVDLGSAAGADMKIAAPKTTFAAKDKIIAAVTTRTADAATAVPSKIAAKWSHVDSNQVVNEEARDVSLQGDQTFDFEITNDKPWPTGKYKVEVMLDGNVVQTREFEVK
jgi:hypothetical protein